LASVGDQVEGAGALTGGGTAGGGAPLPPLAAASMSMAGRGLLGERRGARSAGDAQQSESAGGDAAHEM